MIMIASNTRQRDAIRAAHQERGKMILGFFRALRS